MYSIRAWDDRRDLLVPGDHDATVHACIRHIIAVYQQSVIDHGYFYFVLSGGSTPKELYEILCSSPYKDQLDWSKVWLFWGDERSVPPTDPNNNYHMAMEAGFKHMAVPEDQIHRMEAEQNIELNAFTYEKKIAALLKGRPFDLILLGMGDDGHTASLFPHTKALKATDRQVVANYVPHLNTWRMTLTYPCINRALNKVIYVLGPAKKHVVAQVFKSKNQFEIYPVQFIGTKEHKALWILDETASSELLI